MQTPPNDPTQAAAGAAPASASEADDVLKPGAEPAATPPVKLSPAETIAANRASRRVLVLYNCDYDPPVSGDVANRDRSAVARAAFDVRDAVAACGYQTD